MLERLGGPLPGGGAATPGSRRATGVGPGRGAAPFGAPLGGGGFFSAAFTISSLCWADRSSEAWSGGLKRSRRQRTHSSRFNAAQSTTHSTQSSLPSPSVCQTAFSSGVFPVMLMRVPPPFGPGGFFWIFPNSIRLGGMLWPA